jgi:hypothetical protein
MEENRWRKHVTWDNPEEIEAKYEELSSKIDNVLNPLTISEFQVSQKRLKQSEQFKGTNQGLRTELESLSQYQKPRTPSKSLQKKNEKLAFEMKDMQSQCGDIHWTDVISNPEVRSFLQQYFPSASKISIIDLLGFLEFEYPYYLESQAVKNEIAYTLTLDSNSGHISLNALEILTRDCGLENFISQVYSRVDESIKESKAQINDEILQEVTEIKEMLDSRSVELERKEAMIIAKENKLLKLETSLFNDFKERLEKLAYQTKDKLNKEMNLQMKRMQGLERNINDMIKLARNKQQSLNKSELSVKNSGNDSLAGKLKARISSLEKSNECMKTKISLMELETKADKSTILKLTDELQRIKSRNSMLEQSFIAKKSEPEKPAEPIVTKEEPIKERLKVDPETELVFSIVNILITCISVTLPVIHAPASPRASLIEDIEPSLGETFFPAFNLLVPALIETVPHLYKLNKKDEQTVILKFLWELLVYAWAEQTPVHQDRKFHPNNLNFTPVTPFWKQKLTQERAKASRRPVYNLFSNLTVHKILGFYLLKWMQNKKSTPELILLSSFIISLTSTSKKRIILGLNHIKSLIPELLEEINIKNCINVLVALLDSPDEISAIACEILLSLTVDHLNLVITQCNNEFTMYSIVEASKKAVVNGLKNGNINDFEEGLVIILQKISFSDNIQAYMKQLNLLDVLVQRSSTVQNNSFFQNNLNSIIRNLSN